MARPLVVGDRVQTALGKGTVRELRNAGRVLVEILGRSLVLDAGSVKPIDDDGPSPRRRPAPAEAPPTPETHADPARVREVDLHGLRVEEALARIDGLLDACMRDDVAQLRVIHGRSGGKLRAALHRRLSGISSVRTFRIDAGNPGVTIVWL